MNRRWPHGSTHVPGRELAVGDLVVITGAGAYRIGGFLPAGKSRYRLARLDCAAGLALIVDPAGSYERLNTAPTKTPRRDDSGGSTTEPNELPLAG